MSTDFPRAVENEWIEREIQDNLDHPTNMYLTKDINYVTNPEHGGKVVCAKCNGFIKDGDGVGFLDHQHRDEFPRMWFHIECYDPEKDYWAHVLN